MRVKYLILPNTNQICVPTGMPDVIFNLVK